VVAIDLETPEIGNAVSHQLSKQRATLFRPSNYLDIWYRSLLSPVFTSTGQNQLNCHLNVIICKCFQCKIGDYIFREKAAEGKPGSGASTIRYGKNGCFT
jgi:hypothetical protein